MLDVLVKSVFSQTELVIDPLMIGLSLLVSLGLGLVLASLYKHKTVYSKEFVLTLTVLPTLIAVIIFLVNGNLGTSVAVAGTFSLIKFRSPASSAKELLLVFMATAIGLATGMGYLVLALGVTALVGLTLLALEDSPFARGKSSRRQVLLSLPQTTSLPAVEAVLAETCQTWTMEELALQKGRLNLSYLLALKVTDQDFLSSLLTLGPDVEASLTTTARKKKTL